MEREHKYFPLTPAQEMIYGCLKYTLSESVTNICAMLTLDCEMNPDLFRQSLGLAISRNETSRLRLRKVPKQGVMAYMSDECGTSFVYEDYSFRTDDELEENLKKLSKVPFPNHSLDTQLYDVRMIKKPNGSFSVFFRVSHMAFDAYSLIYMATDFLWIYEALRDGNPIPPSRSDYIRLCETDRAYLESEKKQADLEWWKKEVFSTSPMFNSLDPSKSKRVKGKRYGKINSFFRSQDTHYNYPVPADLVRRVYEAAASFRASPQVFFLLALRSYLSAVNGDEEDVIMNNAVARRATVLQKHSGGSRVTAIPLRMCYGNEMTVREAIKRTSAIQLASYVHSQLPYLDILDLYDPYVKGLMYGFETITLTFNPFRIQAPEGIKCHLTHYSVGVCTLPMYVSVMALDDSGSLNVNYDCMNLFADEKTANAVHRHLLYALDAMITNPEMTLKELNHGNG